MTSVTKRLLQSGDALSVLFEGVKQAGVHDKAVLDRLRPPGGQLSRWQRGEGGRVRKNKARLVEGPHQVLACGEVHCGLSADGSVHHGRQ